MYNTQEQSTKWATFTHIGKETKYIMKLFKNANIKLAYKADKTIGKILRKNSPGNNKYDNVGVYKLNCTECEQ
jgi:hypothetical protein